MIECDHGLGHRFASLIAVKAAEEGMTLSEQVGQPGRIGSGPRGGEATTGGMQGVITEGKALRYSV